MYVIPFAMGRLGAEDPKFGVEITDSAYVVTSMRVMALCGTGVLTKIEELDGSILAGSPDDIVRGVQRYQEIGTDLLIFDFRMRFPDWIEQIKILASEVLPKVGGLAT